MANPIPNPIKLSDYSSLAGPVPLWFYLHDKVRVRVKTVTIWMLSHSIFETHIPSFRVNNSLIPIPHIFCFTRSYPTIIPTLSQSHKPSPIHPSIHP